VLAFGIEADRLYGQHEWRLQPLGWPFHDEKELR
jgi:hypothetical protein